MSTKIGIRCRVGDFSVIESYCTIGDNTRIDARVALKNGIVGKNCIVQPDCVIGEDGFPCERDGSPYLWKNSNILER